MARTLTGLTVGQFIIRHKPLVFLHPGDGLETVLARLSDDTHSILPVTESRWSTV